jgi:hypothetical protein
MDPTNSASDVSISDWLISIGLSHYSAGFQPHQSTPEILFSLTKADLQHCGVDVFGHRRKILLSIKTLKEESGENAAAPPPPTFLIPVPLSSVTEARSPIIATTPKLPNSSNL